MRDMTILFLTFSICSAFLWVFSEWKATRNKEFYVTLLMWLILVYENIRIQFPETLTLPQPYRHIQHQAEMLLLAVYGWEALNYVVHKIITRVQGRN